MESRVQPNGLMISLIYMHFPTQFPDADSYHQLYTSALSDSNLPGLFSLSFMFMYTEHAQK